MFALVLQGCVGDGTIALQQRDDWRVGRDLERVGDTAGALAAYRAAAARGNKIALFDAGRLALKNGKSPEERRQGLHHLCDCANSESAGFYFVQENSEAARAAALAELARAFETGVEVDEDPALAGYLYKEAEAVKDSNAQWFARHSRSGVYSDVFGSVGAIGGGRSRTMALGYSGETYRWSEISERIRPGIANGNARQKRGGKLEIESMSHSGGGDETIFEYRIPEGGEFTLAMDEEVRREMFAKVKREYCARHPGADPSDVRASATNYQKTGNSLTYTVSAFWLRPSELSYSSATRKGILRLRFDGRDVLDAQEWARGHLEELVNAQNVVMTTGQRPPHGARYKVGSVRSIDDGARLEMHFETVE